MTPRASAVPLFVELELTEEQQRQILQQTGISLGGIVFESTARSIRVSFAGLALTVPIGVFVPTSATEHTRSVAVEAASQWRRPVVVDVGTGCGAVALSIAHARRSSTVYGTDISDVAVRAARRNRTRLSLKNVRFLRGSLLSPLPKRLAGSVNVIVANAPYVPPQMSEAFAGSFPEGTAIGLGPDGLDLIREIAAPRVAFLSLEALSCSSWPTFNGPSSRRSSRHSAIRSRGCRRHALGRSPAHCIGTTGLSAAHEFTLALL